MKKRSLLVKAMPLGKATSVLATSKSRGHATFVGSIGQHSGRFGEEGFAEINAEDDLPEEVFLSVKYPPRGKFQQKNPSCIIPEIEIMKADCGSEMCHRQLCDPVESIEMFEFEKLLSQAENGEVINEDTLLELSSCEKSAIEIAMANFKSLCTA